MPTGTCVQMPDVACLSRSPVRCRQQQSAPVEEEVEEADLCCLGNLHLNVEFRVEIDAEITNAFDRLLAMTTDLSGSDRQYLELIKPNQTTSPVLVAFSHKCHSLQLFHCMPNIQQTLLNFSRSMAPIQPKL